MPRKDTTGPQGNGPGSGKGLGGCKISPKNRQNCGLKGQRDPKQGNGQCKRNRGQAQPE